MINNQLHKHLNFLTKTIGTRPKGSKANTEAAKYIEEHFIKCGLTITKQNFPSIKWDAKKTNLIIKNKTLPAVANGFCPSCNIHAPFVAVCNITQLEDTDFSGRILVLYGDLTKQELESKITDNPIYFPELSRKIYAAIEKTPPIALMMIHHDEKITALHNDLNLNIPSITVPATTGKEILACDDKTKLKLSVVSNKSKAISSNIIGYLKGETPEKIVLCSHFDTKFYSPGAFDNGSGMSVLLTLAEILTKQQWKYSFEFLALNGEEFVGLTRGSDVYLKNLGLDLQPFSIGMKIKEAPQFKDIIVAFNFDRLGLFTETSLIGTTQSSNNLKKIITKHISDYPEISQKNATPIGNHYTFLYHGVPCIHCTSHDNIKISHTTQDTTNWINNKKLSNMTQLCVDIINNLMQIEPNTLRKSY